MTHINPGGICVMIMGILCFGILGAVAKQIDNGLIIGIVIVGLGLLILWGLLITISTSDKPSVEAERR
jgi:hypothetical protein